jgi:hypothetical protein
VGADPLRCKAGNGESCVAVEPCWNKPEGDDCLAETEERAWSSPIFLGWVEAGKRGATIEPID